MRTSFRLALIAAALGARVAAVAQEVPAGIELRSVPSLQPPPKGEPGKRLPIILRARELSGRPDLDAVATGDVELRRGPTVIRSDRLTYDQVEDLARATGHVVVTRDGNVFSGPELQLKIDSFEGYFSEPTYRFARTAAGGKARRIDFLDDKRAVASEADYSSCTVEDGVEPPWILRAETIRIDNEENEGIARNAVLRFYGVPILASPYLAFPLNDARKSGFLPPSLGFDSRNGALASIPYYWNIAPNRDATFTIEESLRRGPALDGEYRYLERAFAGEISGRLMPHDSVADRVRYDLRLRHEGELPWQTYAQLRLLRVSDDDYWKDFPGQVETPTPRLLQTDLSLSRPFGDWTSYVRVEKWQLLQTADTSTRIDPAPYERLPQIGLRYAKPWAGGLDVAFETEFNRFDDPTASYLAERQTGLRVHALGSLARPIVMPGWTVTPKLAFNAASYALDEDLPNGRRSATRLIPTASLDSTWTFERETNLFGRAVRQTLEPRLFYVNTPFRRQDQLPNFDAFPKDFNYDTIFTENAFSGVDRVSDSNQLTAGLTTRVIDAETGAETLRLGAVQRYQFRDQRVTADGTPQTRRFSDFIVFGSTTLVPKWTFDVSAEYNFDDGRFERSITGFRYSPGPYRTVNLTYRLSRGLSEQVELGWQWPLFGSPPSAERRQTANGACGGTLYSVGRINYSTRDRRLTDAIAGFEYDAGCWIGRVVAERLSTGLSESTTRVLVQLELVGLSRLGSNPLKVLQDNIPGYRLLREERTSNTPFSPYE